ncbi:MAG: hypothetical protein GY913_26265 [Proteobacteria bacterium]|nr:hypothetical protein [Pseudomonadota bacterium]MCP4920422.1 hypothetical protein [Pseudomonadota bacterium]
MSWVLLLGAVYAQDEETSTPPAPPSELEQLEEEILVTEARIRLAEAQLRLTQMEARVDDTSAVAPEGGGNVVTEDVEVKPDPTPEVAETIEVVEEVRVVERIVESGSVTAGGDVFVQLVAGRLDNMHPDVVEDPTLEFQLSRVRPNVQGQLGERATGFLSLDVLPDGAGGFAIRPLDVWARYETERGGRITIGQQLTPFGSVDTFTPGGHYQVPGWGFRIDPVRTEGLLPYRSVGVFWQRDLGDKMSVDLGVMNSGIPETQIAKDWSGRLTLAPMPALTASVSVLAGPGLGGETKVLWDGLVEGTAGTNHALLEVFGRQGYGPDDLGVFAGIGRDILLDGPALNRVTPALNFTWFDPDTGTDVDEHIRFRAGVTESWGHDHPGRFETGLGYEVLVPDNVDLAIEHSLIFDTRIRF